MEVEEYEGDEEEFDVEEEEEDTEEEEDDEDLDFMDDWLEETQSIKVERRAWMDQCEMSLGTVDNIDAIIDACIESGRYAIDLETSGLDNRVFDGRTKDHIAGICLSPDGVRGFYIPVMHDPDKYGEHNVPSSVWVPALSRLISSKSVAIFHNGKFDHEFLQWNGNETLGEWDRPSSWEDTLILAYLRNTRARSRKLKDLSEAPPDADETSQGGGPGLGMEMIRLHELWGHSKEKKGFDYDFSTLDPSWEPCIWYGASDAICTYRLFDLLLPAVTQGEFVQKSIYKVEKLCVAATRWMERNRILVGREKVLELISLGQQEWLDSISDLYAEANKILGRDVMPGYLKVVRDVFVPDDPHYLLTDQKNHAKSISRLRYPDPQGTVTVDDVPYPMIYDVGSPAQLGKMFQEMKVPGLKYTEKTGQVVTRKAILDEIIDKAGKKFPFMAKVKRFREIWKALGSYLYPMLLDVEPSDGSMRIGFQAHRVDTGRFSTPAKDEARAQVPGWPQVNIHSIPATYDPKRPACMTRLRECIIARPGYFIVAIDFSGEELRIVTNLSREPKWLAEFFHCSSCDLNFSRGDGKTTPPPPPPRCPKCGSDKIGDLHTLTGLELFGSDAPQKDNWKKLRGDAKSSNFALCYGGGGHAVQVATGCNKEEGWRIKRQFDKTYKGLHQWWQGQHAFAKKHGFVLTAFGRRYPVPDIHNVDKFWRAKAERNAVNGPVQGTGSDLCKIAMALVYKEFKKRGWLDRARLICTMHDELVFEVEAGILEEMVDVTPKIMTSNGLIMSKNWPIPFTTDVEIGTDWTVPWDLTAMRAGEVRFVGEKKYKDQSNHKNERIPEGMVWEQMQKFPDSLKDLFQNKDLGVPAPPSPPASSPPPTPPASSPPPAQATPQGPPAQVMSPPAPTMPAVQEMSLGASPSSGGKCVYRLNAPLTLETVYRLAEIIRQCRAGGTSLLVLQSSTGENLDGWLKTFNHPEVLVSDVEFRVLAKSNGL